MEVRALDREPGRRRAADPEVGDAPRVLPPDELVLVDALAEAGDLDPLAFFERHPRHVDVEQLALGQPVLEDVARDDAGRDRGKAEVGVLVILLADRERRAPVDGRFHRRAHRSRVRDVVAEVRAVVDAGGDEVEAVPEVAEEREADRVRRRPIDRERRRSVGERSLADAERAHEGLLVADRALVRVGCDDGRFADLLEGLLEREEAARLDAVVVRDEDPGTGGPVAQRLRGTTQAARPTAGGATGKRLPALEVDVAALRTSPLAGHLGFPRAPFLGHPPGSAAGRPPGSAAGRPPASGARRRPRSAGRRSSPTTGGAIGSASSTSGSTPGSGSMGTRTAFPSRAAIRRAARWVTVPPGRVRPR